jgi:mono/diheme cytochrome c family protein
MRTTGLPHGLLVAASLASASIHASATSPPELQAGFEAAARSGAAGFAGFSAQRGERFFKARHGGEWACASCHTENPLGPGRHARTGKSIAPLAPTANAQRFTVAGRVEKWFRRNCNDVLGRPCTAQEKGDVLEYLMSLK